MIYIDNSHYPMIHKSSGEWWKGYGIDKWYERRRMNWINGELWYNYEKHTTENFKDEDDLEGRNSVTMVEIQIILKGTKNTCITA
jgi:hypothetical protein